MKEISHTERRMFVLIASFYGCKVKFLKAHEGGSWDYKKTISIGTCKLGAYDYFCHELAHYKNSLTNKYHLYHTKSNKELRSHFKTFKQVVRYSLNAEIHTEKVAIEIMKEWFPKKRYVRYYKNTKKCLEYMYNYYK